MRGPLPAFLVLLPLLAPLASALEAEPPAPVAPAMDAVGALLEIAAGRGDPTLALAAQIARQEGRHDAMLAAQRLAVPPDVIYREARAACDLDADGVGDVFVNNLTLTRPPSHASAGSEIEAISGRTGARLWKVDNLGHATLPAPPSVEYHVRGQAFPDAPGTSIGVDDLDGDGVCDLVAYGFEGMPGLSTPFLGEPSIRNMRFVLRALSGATGEEVWSIPHEASTISASEPFFNAGQLVVTQGFPTGVLTFSSAEGPRVLLKLTDIRYQVASSPIAPPPLPTLDPQRALLKGEPRYEDVRIVERIQLRDAVTGDVVWERLLGSESSETDVDARFTNLTWLAGVAQLGGGAEPDVVLDQLLLSTPRTSEANHPATGDTLFRYGRGARVTTLDGASGATLWSTATRDPLAAQANTEPEETFETLAWTRAETMPDLDGDGVDDVLAAYTAREESLATSAAGAYRTHFLPISGANGSVLWDVRQQGWGRAQPLDAGPVTRLALGMLDVPARPAEAGLLPPRFIRLVVLDAASGTPVWSDERTYAQGSPLSYNLALAQFVETLAPHDWDADGLLDVVSPARPTARTSRDQVLLATSSHEYTIHSGADGRELALLRAWGPDGRVVHCDGDPSRLTVLSGHGRRLELARYDPIAGSRLWRAVVHHDAAPRAASTAIDITGLAASCAERPEGTLFAVDLQAYSFDRGHEVVPILGVADEGRVSWQAPALRDDPPGEALFQASLRDSAPTTAQRWGAAGAAAAAGVVAGIATLAILARRGSRLLVVAGVLLVLAPSAASLALPRGIDVVEPTPAAAAPAVERPETQLPRVTEADATRAPDGDATALAALQVAAARERVLGSSYSNESLSRFSGNETLSFSHAIGDVDGDGWDDLALDQYCLSDACLSGGSFPEWAFTNFVYFHCGYPHDLVVVSGRTGEPLWTRDLGVYGHLGSCGEHFVVGAFDAGGESAILLYRFRLIWSVVNLEGTAHHEIIAISAATGEPLWTRTATGAYATDFVTWQAAKDYLVIPILQRGPEGDAIFLQGIGWAASLASSVFPVIPEYRLTDDAVILWDVYEPVEWLARVDPATGADVWRRDTFLPGAGVNQFPRAFPVDLERSYSYNFREASDHYWETRACCGDLTGDGEPDVVFTVLEWSRTPLARVEGPREHNARTVVFDGATGATHLDLMVAEDTTFERSTRFGPRHDYFLMGAFVGWFREPVLIEPVGDADGDGADDMLQHVITYNPEFRQRIDLVSGASGEIRWSVETHRDLRALVLGDADGDGGNDMLLVDWYGHEAGTTMEDDYATPAAIPLTLVSGRTGETIWRTTTYAAPADVVETYRALWRNGAVDVDADGVGDFFTDDPFYLDDQTVVHNVAVVSGRTGEPLRSMRAVGAFAIPAGAGDLDADGRDEIALLAGDVNDLWLTVHDGASGEAEWSRRILALPASGYARVLPKLQLDALARPDGADLLVTFHAEVARAYSYLGLCIGCDEGDGIAEYTGTYFALMPQILQLGSDGRHAWALPALDAEDAAAVVPGITPGVSAFDRIAERAAPLGLFASAGRDARPFVIPAGAGFVAAYAIALAAGVAVFRFRGRFAGVPELE